MTVDGRLSDERKRLERFAMRARRIAAHTLTRDPEELRRLATGEWKLRIDRESGRSTILRELASEQEVESLAARVRPLLLQSESIHYDKVLNAMSTFVRRQDPERAARFARTVAKPLKAAFAEIDPTRAKEVAGYEVATYAEDGAVVAPKVSMATLAKAWLYNDLVHADADVDVQIALTHTLQTRFAAATTVYTRAALLTLNAFHFVKQFQDEGLLELAPECFEDEVVVTARVIEQEAQVWSAPTGTRMPEPGTLPDENWEKMGAQFMRD